MQLLIEDNTESNQLYETKIKDKGIEELNSDIKQKICRLFEIIIESEKSNEYYRNILAMTPNSSGFDLFNLLKKKEASGIDKEDISNFIYSMGEKLGNDEIEIIFKKLTKNNDNLIIDYTQFVSEITPKSVN